MDGDKAPVDGEGDRVFGRFNRLLRKVQGEDDRSMTLLFCAFIEDALGRLVLNFLRDDAASRELVEGFNAPLGTFAARSRAAYALGLVSQAQYRNLNLLRKVRNEFAHNWEVESFDDASVASLVDGMDESRIYDLRPDKRTRHLKVQHNAATILMEMQLLTERLPAQRLQDRHMHIGLSPQGPFWSA